QRTTSIASPEKYPTHYHRHKSDGLSQADFRASGRAAQYPRPNRTPGVIDRQIRGMKTTPDDETPGRPMPKAAKNHCENKIRVAPGDAAAVPAQRDVDIITEESRQSDVPALPEVNDARCFV